jgi:hypothetical protein
LVIEGFGLSRSVVTDAKWRIERHGLTAAQAATLDDGCPDRPPVVPQNCACYNGAGGQCGVSDCTSTPPGAPSCNITCTGQGASCAWCEGSYGACCRCILTT